MVPHRRRSNRAARRWWRREIDGVDPGPWELSQPQNLLGRLVACRRLRGRPEAPIRPSTRLLMAVALPGLPLARRAAAASMVADERDGAGFAGDASCHPIGALECSPPALPAGGAGWRRAGWRCPAARPPAPGSGRDRSISRGPPPLVRPDNSI